MRRILVVLVLALVPLLAFAEVQLGIVGTFNPSLAGGSTVTSLPTQLGQAAFSDVSFGLETRLKAGILQLGTSVVFYDDGSSPALDLMPTAGLALDILIVRLGLSVGPDFWFGGDGLTLSTAFDGWNLKGSVEILLGSVCIGLEGVYWLPKGEAPASIPAAIKDGVLPWLGATVLIRF